MATSRSDFGMFEKKISKNIVICGFYAENSKESRKKCQFSTLFDWNDFSKSNFFFQKIFLYTTKLKFCLVIRCFWPTFSYIVWAENDRKVKTEKKMGFYRQYRDQLYFAIQYSICHLPIWNESIEYDNFGVRSLLGFNDVQK